jgi:hypothetical protein
MTFKQILEKARENHIPVYKLMAGTAVDNFLENEGLKLSETEFEQVCEFVYDWILNTAASADEVVERLIPLVQESDTYTFDNIYQYWQEITDDLNRMF